jgi:hypothetical protein
MKAVPAPIKLPGLSMDEITTIKLRSSNLEGEYSQFEYDFGCYLTAAELANYAALITEIFQYSPEEIREAIQQWNEHKYDRFVFINERKNKYDTSSDSKVDNDTIPPKCRTGEATFPDRISN